MDRFFPAPDAEKRIKRIEKSSDGIEGLIQSFPDIIARVNGKGEILFVNQAIEKHFKKPASFFIGKLIDEGFQETNPTFGGFFSRKFKEAVDTCRPVQSRLTTEVRQGPCLFHFSLIPEIGPNGECTSVIAHIRDENISGTVDSSGVHTKDIFQQLSDKLNHVVWLRTKEDILHLSPSYEKVFGQRLDEALQNPKSFLELVHPADRERVEGLYEKYVRDEEAFEAEYRIQRPDGTIGWVRARGFPIRTYDGTIHLAGMAEDVTLSKRMEEELIRREEQYRVLVEHSPDKLVRYDRDFRRIYASPEVARLYGMEPEELCGTTLKEVTLSPKMVSRFEQGLSHVFATGKPVTIEVEIENHSGVFWQQIRLIPEFATDGRVETVMEVGRDITDLKIAQIELQLAHDVLEYRIRKRTEELEHINTQLLREIGEREKAEEQAKKANQTKNEFLANMSHEIRTPLSGIKGIAEMMLSRKQDA
ncbi:MAG: PAS domain S-box protein, partial [Desulfovibrionales bacterium]